MANETWRRAIGERFVDRQDMGRDGVFAAYFSAADTPYAGVMKVFDFIEAEWGVPAGLLRPDDGIELLVAPIRARNPLQSVHNEMIASDASIELADKLYERLGLKRVWLGKPKVEIRTIGDLVRAWCRPAAPE